MPTPNITTKSSGASSGPTWKCSQSASVAVMLCATSWTAPMMTIGSNAISGLRNTSPSSARISTTVAIPITISAFS